MKTLMFTLFVLASSMEVNAAAVRGADDTTLLYDVGSYKGATWKRVDGADSPDARVEFRSVTGWDKNNLLILGETSAGTRGNNSLLLDQCVDGDWRPTTQDVEGHYATYQARFYAKNSFMFAYSGRSGSWWSVFEDGAESRLGGLGGLRGELRFNTFYRLNDNHLVFHPCPYNQLSTGDPQVFVYDGKSVAFLTPDERGHYIQTKSGQHARWTSDHTRRDSEMFAGSIVAVHRPSAKLRVGLWNHLLADSSTRWKTAVVTAEGDDTWRVAKLFPFVTKQILSSWALNDSQMVIADTEAIYLYDGGNVKRLSPPSGPSPICVWGKSLTDFFTLTADGAVYHVSGGQFHSEVGRPDLKNDKSANEGHNDESYAKIMGRSQVFANAWVSPEGVIFAVRSLDVYKLEPK